MRWPIILGALFFIATAANARELRVCADPNNLPFSNRSGQGFENKLAELIASQLGATVKYTWWPQRGRYVSNTLTARKCDLWPGIVSGVEKTDATRPYYRSTYVFVTRADRNLNIRSFNDPRLKNLIIGVEMGDDESNSPPTYALARRGITNNVRGYMLHGDYARPDPTRPIIDAVESGKLDMAVVWGPMAGYFAALEPKPLALTPVRPQFIARGLPMAFNIAMGVRPGDTTLKRQVNQALERKQAAIDAILTEYHVPWVPPTIVTTNDYNHPAVHNLSFTDAHTPVKP